MKIGLDPHIHQNLQLPELCRKTAELDYAYKELSPRNDFLPWWVRPRTHKERVAEFGKVLTDHGVFGWEERADASGRFMGSEIHRCVDRHWRGAAPDRPEGSCARA